MKVYLLIEDEPNSDEFPYIVVSVHATLAGAEVAKALRLQNNLEERDIDPDDDEVSVLIEVYEVEP